MNDTHVGSDTRSPAGDSPRWPRVVGTVGVVIGVLVFIDPLDDLLFRLAWTERDWQRFLGPEIAELVSAVMPPAAWLLIQAVAQLTLGGLLVVGALRLRRRRSSGARLCRLWAWLAVAWVGVMAVWAMWQLPVYSAGVSGLVEGGWQAFATVGVVAALALLLAFPVFLLVWLSRTEIRAEIETWNS